MEIKIIKEPVFDVIKEKDIKIYITKDGKEFRSQRHAKKHEEKIIERDRIIKKYNITSIQLYLAEDKFVKITIPKVVSDNDISELYKFLNITKKNTIYFNNEIVKFNDVFEKITDCESILISCMDGGDYYDTYNIFNTKTVIFLLENDLSNLKKD